MRSNGTENAKYPRVRASSCNILGALILSLTCFFSVIPTARAGYNANMTGTVSSVLTYTHTSLILFRLNNQPKHPKCKSHFFAIASSTTADIRHQVLSRLLIAYSSKTPINIGYDQSGGCAHGWIKVYRVG